MEGRALRLTVRSGPQAGSSLGLPDEEVVRIGSSRACQLVLQAEGILKIHCCLKCSGGRYLLVVDDKEATVLVNGKDTRRKFLAPGDVLEIGGVSIVLEVFREDPLVGRTLGGYRVERLLGRGSMGRVYQATQLSLQREVALKILSPELTKDENFVQEFLKEARASAKLNHPNVVQVIDAAREGDAFFFSMEFLPGGTLAQLLQEQGQLSVGAALRVACDTARALAWAQENGIVHRDIKPDNLLFAADGTVKVADLGIAADLFGVSKEGAGRSVGLGSPRYMAPEQALRKPVDQRADIYALGSTLYRMIAGRAPFEGKTAVEIVRAKTTREAIPLSSVAPGVSAELSETVQAMLARDPDQRPSSSLDVLAKLEECLATVEAEAKGAAEAGRGAPPSRLVASASSWISTLWMSTYGRVALAAAGFLALLALMFALAWKPPATSAPGAGDGSPDSGANVAKVTQQPPEPVALKKEKGLPGEPSGPRPEGFPPETARDPKLEAALGELREIHRDHFFNPRKSLADLEAFQRKHPEPELAQSVERVMARIQETLKEEGKQTLDKAMKELRPILQACEFNEARQKLQDLAAKCPDNREEIDAEIRKVDDAAGGHWKALQDQVDKLLEAADFTRAAALLAGLEKKYTPDLHGAIESKSAAVALAEKEHVQGSRTIEAALAKIREALSSLDFDGAVSLATGIPDFKSPLLARRKETLSSEVGRSKAAWEKLRASLSAIVQRGETVALAFEPEPAQTQGFYRVAAFEGGILKVQKEKGSKIEEKHVFTLAAKSLLRLLTAGSGPEPKEGEPSFELVEGLGLLFLHVQSPARAKEILADARLTPEKALSYRARIDSETPAFLSSLVAREAARVGKLSAAAAEGSLMISRELLSEAECLSAELGRSISLYRAMAGYLEFRKELAWLFLQARAVALRATAPQCFFKGKVASVKPDGTLKLVYAFKTNDELQDFVPIQSGSGMQEHAEKKAVAIKGEIRLGRGDIFRNRLSVTGRVPSGGYTISAPNINLALWTRDHDAVAPLGRPVSSEAQPAGMVDAVGNEFIVFGIGYKARAYDSDDLTPRGFQQSIRMPANALFLGTRGLPLHSSRAKDDCLWATPHPQSGARQSFSVEMQPDSFPKWTVNQYRVIPDQDSRKIESAAIHRRKVRVGSVTLFTNGQVVDLEFLSVEGELNPAWLEVELLRRAEEDLKAVEPDFPFRKKADSKEEGEQGSRWPDLVASCLELRSLRDSLARKPEGGGGEGGEEGECLSILQRMVWGLKEGAPAALASRVQQTAMEATSSIAPDNVELWAEVAQVTMHGGDVEGAYRLLERKVRAPNARYVTAGVLRLSRLRRQLLREVGSYVSIDANLAASAAIVPEGATWRYFPGETPPSVGLEWTRVKFDDSAWKEGQSGFGYGDDDLVTVFDDMRDKYSTVYLRRTFRLPDPCPWTGFTLSVTADDGFVAYLNGTEVGRERAPGPPGTQVRFDDVATDRAPEPEPTTEIRLDPEEIPAGDNVLAIQGLNVRDSGDFILTACLLGVTPPGPDHDRRRFGNLLSSGKAPVPAHLHSYLEGRLLERAGQHAAAAREFRRVLEADRSRVEPFLCLAESLRGAGDAAAAEGILLEAIGSGIEDCELLLDLWFTIGAVDEKRGAAEILAAFPSLPEGSAEARGQDIRWVLETLRAGGAVRLNSGGDEYKGVDGRVWGRDRFYSPAAYRYSGDGMGAAKEPFTAKIAGTEDDRLYQTERWFARYGMSPSGYRIPLPSGRYRVTLHFAEIFFRNVGERVFDVLIEGKKKLEAYDTIQTGFATAERESFEVSVGDGWLDIELVHRTDNPKLSAVEVEKLE